MVAQSQAVPATQPAAAVAVATTDAVVSALPLSSLSPSSTYGKRPFSTWQQRAAYAPTWGILPCSSSVKKPLATNIAITIPTMTTAPPPPSTAAAMARPVGEDSWLAYLEESTRIAPDLEQRVKVIELYKRAVSTEVGSLRLWLAYCNYFWHLWHRSHTSDSDWSDNDRAMGRELFTFDAALGLWQQGYEAIRYRLDDSHLLWDRWLSLEMKQLAKTRTADGIKRITHLYRDRLATPHLTWDDTAQAFSTFLSEYHTTAWENTMSEVTANAQATKRIIAARSPFELKLQDAARVGLLDSQKSCMKDYLEWEMLQSKRNNDAPEIAIDLCCGLFARALCCLFTADEDIWYEYVVFVSSSKFDSHIIGTQLDILQRAVQHCPWSGRLWSRYILCAEEAKLPFSEIESIKHAATSENQLYKNGMEGMLEMYVAWCAFLKRTALEATATDEAVDIAHVGLRAALEDVEVVGKRLYGKTYQGDPKFRLERIYIQYLTEKKGALDEARAVWSKLTGTQIHADDHDFWFQYYLWEMLIFSSTPSPDRSPTPSSADSHLRVPSAATAVLHAAATRRTIDWPEKVLEVYLQHCNDYEHPSSVRRVTDMVHRMEKGVRKRRQREEQEKLAAYAAYYGSQQEDSAISLEGTQEAKRRREDLSDANDAAGDNHQKRRKSDAHAEEKQPAVPAESRGRDRENATVLVTNLPPDVTQTKLRQYFKDYGHINSITALVRDTNDQSSTALIEFRSHEEASSALLRDGKYFGQAQLSVTTGYDLTVYVANFPPAADEQYIRHLFKDCGEVLSVRWPSLKVNAHRRFCYVSFRDRAASAKAVAKEGKLLDHKFKLLARYSDPARKKPREGAVAQGREVHVSNLDRAIQEEELRTVFAKFGTVQRVNLPINMAGKNRGFAFLDFESKEQAYRAVDEMNNTKFHSQILQVELSKETKVKPAAKIVGAVKPEASSPCPPRQDGASEDRDSGKGHQAEGTSSTPAAAQIAARTIAFMGLPETINDTRVRALVEPFGIITKLVLQPGRGGASIEFADAATAGKATLQLDGMAFEGSTLRVGSVKELRHARSSHKDDRITYGHHDPRKAAKDQESTPKNATSIRDQSFLPTPATLRRSGPRRGVGFAPRKALPNTAVPVRNGNVTTSDQDSTTHPKSNAEFKAIFLGGTGTGVAKEESGEIGAGSNGA